MAKLEFPWDAKDGEGMAFWDMLPIWAARDVRESYAHRAALFEYECGLPRKIAELKAYAFMFSETPDVIAPFVPDDQIETQLRRARVFKGDRSPDLHKDIVEMWNLALGEI